MYDEMYDIGNYDKLYSSIIDDNGVTTAWKTFVKTLRQ